MNQSIIYMGLMIVFCTIAHATNEVVAITKQNPPTTQNTITTSTTTSNQEIDCSYHIPPETQRIDQSIVLKWSIKAALQSFEFTYGTIENQLTSLKSCYTDQGWQSFNDALQKSGNIKVIKSQQLTSHSIVDGQTKITAIKDNQWKIGIPVQIVYQNSKEKFTQLLMIDLMVGRKMSGDLGIMQLIAGPRNVLNQTKPQNGKS